MSLLSAHVHNGYFATNDSDPVASAGTTVTSSASANTYGTWTQIHAGFTHATTLVDINITNLGANATNKNCYIDIGVGASSGAVCLLIEKLGGCGAGPGLGINYLVPIRIPPDTPVWARHQNVATSQAAGVQITAHGGNQNIWTMPTITSVAALGATTASTVGTTVVVGASGAEGSWTQIVASTTTDYAGAFISFFNNGTAHTAGVVYSFDLAMGASGQEQTIGENLTRSSPISSAEQFITICHPTLLGIPSGARLSVRGSCTGAVVTTTSVIINAFTH